ncbi:MAG: sugar ABC transporter permease [Candidatus Sericytochromatia bacterium]|nr:sugar ABC transporter permease [Candidatus Sericytochromatia bacterium]
MVSNTRVLLEPAGSPFRARTRDVVRIALPYLFLLPAAVILCVFLFLPLGYAFVLSFTDFNALVPPQWLGVANYQRLVTDPVFWTTMRNTVVYLAGVVPALVILPLLLAVLVNRSLPGIAFFRAAYYLPVVISMVVAGLMWKWIFAENGLLNYLLGLVVPWLADHPVAWLSRPETALAAVMVVTIWKGLGYYMVIYLAGLQTIPSDIYESAAIDGASRWQALWRLTVPLLWPSITFVAIVSSISALKTFTEIYVMTDGGPLNASTTVVYYLYQQSFQNLNMGYANAIGMVLFVLILVFSVLNVRAFEKGQAPN